MASFSISAVVRENARIRPGSAAITESESGRVSSWADLDANVDKVAAALLADGVERGDRVAFWGHNCIEFFELLFAASRIGATFVPLNWNLNDDEIDLLLQEMEAVTCVTDATFASRLNRPALVVGRSYDAWRDGHAPAEVADTASASDVFVQPYTSGTTGVPKGVMITNDNLDAFVRASEMLGYGHTSAQLLSLPNYHIGGCVFPLLAAVAGGQLVIVRRFTAMSVLDTIEKFRITHLNLVPTMINLVIDEQEKQARDVSSVRLIVYGAAPVTAQTVSRAKQILGVSLLQEYASTECLAITLLGPEEHVAERLTTVGRPFPGVTLEIRDPDSGEPLPAHSRGEVCVASKQCTVGYRNRPEESKRLFTPDGFIRTGDTGYLDSGGYLRLTGRVGDMIVTGGENVYPTEIEAILIQHQSVDDVAVVGVPDERWGEIVVAFVVPRQDSRLSARELLDWSHARLTGYRRPRRIAFIEALPRNPTGKIERARLRNTQLANSIVSSHVEAS